MKSFTILYAVLVFLNMTTCFAQEKTKKQLKEERKIEQEKQTEVLINSKSFVFVGRMAYPTGYRSVDLTTNSNYVKFSPDRIESYMPFFGKAYSGIGYGGDQGLKFEGKPQLFNISKVKKHYLVDAEVKGTNDLFRLSLSVFYDGSASLSITSNNRGFISYSGEISVQEKGKE